jgi:hypothetical protein
MNQSRHATKKDEHAMEHIDAITRAQNLSSIATSLQVVRLVSGVTASALCAA